MDSEVALHEELTRLSALATVPRLYGDMQVSTSFWT